MVLFSFCLVGGRKFIRYGKENDSGRGRKRRREKREEEEENEEEEKEEEEEENKDGEEKEIYRGLPRLFMSHKVTLKARRRKV